MAAVVELNRWQIGFDYDQAAAVARVYGAPGISDLVGLARGAVADRRRMLGVPPRGDAPAPAGFALTPYAFTCSQLAVDACVVTVLSLATMTSTSGVVSNVFYRGTQLLHWITEGDQGDWKIVRPSSTEEQQIASLPDLPAIGPLDPRFDRSGWATVASGATR